MAIHRYNNSFSDTPKNVYQGSNSDNLPLEKFASQRERIQDKVLQIHKARDDKIIEKRYKAYEPNAYAFEKTNDISKRMHACN